MQHVNRDEIIKLIIDERIKRMSNLDNDLSKTKNDWTGLAGYYLFESSSRSDKHVTFDEFRQSLIKSAAVILAALETSFSLEEDDSALQNLLKQLENKNDTE